MGRRPYNKDLTGKRYGLLVIEGLSDKVIHRPKADLHLWRCRCDCGEVVYKTTSELNYNKTNGCKKCMKEHRITTMHSAAGFVGGTQLSKIQNIDRLPARSKSGIRGVYLENGRWRARLRFKGKNYNFGTYSTIKEAEAARKQGEKEIYGKFLETINQ